MFKSLIDFWKGEGFLKSVIGEFGNMLSDSRDMFKMVCDDILKDKKISVLKDKIYGVDKKINTLEKDIRKRIIEHLSIQPGVDSPMCLLLMSVVKDAERLGDYAKNLYHVSRMTHRPFDNDTFLKLFNGMDETILKMFDDTKKAFIESD